MTRNPHGYPLGDSGPYHVPYGRSPKVMEDLCRHPYRVALGISHHVTVVIL